MKLTKINYVSAVFFGILGFISMFILGLLGMISPEIAALLGSPIVLPFWSVVVGALIQGVAGYIGVVFSILVYNIVAQKFPVSWNVSK